LRDQHLTAETVKLMNIRVASRKDVSLTERDPKKLRISADHIEVFGMERRIRMKVAMVGSRLAVDIQAAGRGCRMAVAYREPDIRSIRVDYVDRAAVRVIVG